MPAIVLDVDDTTLTTWNYELFSDWDFNSATNANFVGLTGATFTGEHVPRHAGNDRPGQGGEGLKDMRSSSSPVAATRTHAADDRENLRE